MERRICAPYACRYDLCLFVAENGRRRSETARSCFPLDGPLGRSAFCSPACNLHDAPLRGGETGLGDCRKDAVRLADSACSCGCRGADRNVRAGLRWVRMTLIESRTAEHDVNTALFHREWRAQQRLCIPLKGARRPPSVHSVLHSASRSPMHGDVGAHVSARWTTLKVRNTRKFAPEIFMQ